MDKDSAAPLRLTVIVEWENVLLSELKRCKAMLIALQAQCRDLVQGRERPFTSEQQAFLKRFVAPVELLVVYNDEEVDNEVVERTVGDIIGDGGSLLDISLLRASGCHYYEQKNFGFRNSSGDVVLLLDSDVIPDEGWLCHLLASFADPACDVVGGNSYIETKTTTGKAFALMWTFPLRDESQRAVLEPSRQFFANNVAFRRKIIDKYLFPRLEGVTRGACTALAKQLRSDSVGLYRNARAQVEHPPPNGFSHFFLRAIAHGRDKVLATDNSKTLRLQLSSHCIHPFKRAWRRRSRVKMSLFEVPLIITIISAYVGTRGLAIAAAYGWPESMKAPRFRV